MLLVIISLSKADYENTLKSYSATINTSKMKKDIL